MVSQSGFASGVGGFGNLQADANSGCDQDFYGLTNDHNVLSNVSGVPKSFWTAKLGASYTVKAILFIENEFAYSPLTYSPSWLLTYQITLGDNSDGFNNPVCVALGTIKKGGWGNCGLTGQYLSVISTT